ncbi:NEDD8-specific protease 1 [Raphanus sativus]|nr:NEDD8-specific protease 1 [Raphanus sativus]
MGYSSDDDKILSYNDVVLRRSDLDILNGPNFLNDRIIEFYLSYLSTVHTSSAISLIPPSIAFWISNCPDTESLKDFIEPLRLLESDLLIFPVNEQYQCRACRRRVTLELTRLFEAVSPFVSDGDAMYRECSDTPQQKNGYDCGVYLLAIARVICQWFSSGGVKNRDELWFTDVKETVPDLVNHLREEMSGLIRRLISEKSATV